jgi:predicted metalloprotease with PDZ domain
MANFDEHIFGKKSFSDLMKEIYDNSKKKEAQISALISELKPLINDIGDATLIVPLIKEYMEIGVKNDEHLIKLAAIVQRAMQNSTSNDGSLGISDEEKQQLLDEIQKFKS